MQTSNVGGLARERGRAALLAVVTLALFVAGCKTRGNPGPAAKRPAGLARAAVETRAPAFIGSVVPGPAPLLKPVLKFVPADGLRGPTAIIHDETADHYLLTNVDGLPLAADGKAFISKLDPNGGRLIARWIESGKNGVVLNAPQGLALRDDELYVTDIDTVRVFHRTTGRPLGEVKLPGTTNLADIVLAADGGLLVADKGLDAGPRGDQPGVSARDALYVIYRDERSTHTSIVANRELGGPAALFATPTKIWTVASRSGELYSVDERGKLGDFEKLPGGMLEGITGIGDDLLVSSRSANAIFRGRSKSGWHVAIGDVKDSGHIGYDPKRHRVLVPLPLEDEVRLYALE